MLFLNIFQISLRFALEHGILIKWTKMKGKERVKVGIKKQKNERKREKEEKGGKRNKLECVVRVKTTNMWHFYHWILNSPSNSILCNFCLSWTFVSCKLTVINLWFVLQIDILTKCSKVHNKKEKKEEKNNGKWKRKRNKKAKDREKWKEEWKINKKKEEESKKNERNLKKERKQKDSKMYVIEKKASKWDPSWRWQEEWIDGRQYI